MSKAMFIVLVTIFSCTIDCPEECLSVFENGSNVSFELQEMDAGLSYYLSFKNDQSGVVSQQFPSWGRITMDDVGCQEYFLFVFETSNTSEVNKAISDFHNQIDTSMVYWCSGLVNCNYQLKI